MGLSLLGISRKVIVKFYGKEEEEGRKELKIFFIRTLENIHRFLYDDLVTL